MLAERPHPETTRRLANTPPSDKTSRRRRLRTRVPSNLRNRDNANDRSDLAQVRLGGGLGGGGGEGGGGRGGGDAGGGGACGGGDAVAGAGAAEAGGGVFGCAGRSGARRSAGRGRAGRGGRAFLEGGGLPFAEAKVVDGAAVDGRRGGDGRRRCGRTVLE